MLDAQFSLQVAQDEAHHPMHGILIDVTGSCFQAKAEIRGASRQEHHPEVASLGLVCVVVVPGVKHVDAHVMLALSPCLLCLQDQRPACFALEQSLEKPRNAASMIGGRGLYLNVQATKHVLN